MINIYSFNSNLWQLAHKKICVSFALFSIIDQMLRCLGNCPQDKKDKKAFFRVAIIPQKVYTGTVNIYSICIQTKNRAKVYISEFQLSHWCHVTPGLCKAAHRARACFTISRKWWNPKREREREMEKESSGRKMIWKRSRG